MFNGVASRAEHSLKSGGLSADASLELTDRHTLRGGLSFTAERADVNTSNWVFPATWDGASWAQAGIAPIGFSAFGNCAFCRAMAYGMISGQFQFDAEAHAFGVFSAESLPKAPIKPRKKPAFWEALRG